MGVPATFKKIVEARMGEFGLAGSSGMGQAVAKKLAKWPNYKPEIFYDESQRFLFVSPGDWEVPENSHFVAGGYPDPGEVEKLLLEIPGVEKVEIEPEAGPSKEEGNFVKITVGKASHPVGEATLKEVLGTYGWYNPTTGEEVRSKPGNENDHYNMVFLEPGKFGVAGQDFPSREDMLNRVVNNGWVRMSYYGGEVFVQARSEEDARKAVMFYREELPYDYITLDLPGFSTTIPLGYQSELWLRGRSVRDVSKTSTGTAESMVEARKPLWLKYILIYTSSEERQHRGTWKLMPRSDSVLGIVRMPDTSMPWRPLLYKMVNAVGSVYFIQRAADLYIDSSTIGTDDAGLKRLDDVFAGARGYEKFTLWAWNGSEFELVRMPLTTETDPSGGSSQGTARETFESMIENAQDDSIAKKLKTAVYPDAAEEGKAFCFFWADGRGICAFKNRKDAIAWIEDEVHHSGADVGSDDNGPDIVKFWYGKPEYHGKHIRVDNSYKVHAESVVEADAPMVCAWCGREVSRANLDPTKVGGPIVGHTICADCRKRFQAKIQRVKASEESITEAAKVFDTDAPPSDNTDKDLGYAVFYDEKAKVILGWHVTDNADRLVELLRTRPDLMKFGNEHDELGPGLYISGAPQLWMGRAVGKWDFLDKLEDTQRQTLSDALGKIVLNQRQTGYISEPEYETANKDLGRFVQDPKTWIIYLADQPYNIPFWKKTFLDPLGVEQSRPPEVVEVTLRGKFAGFENMPGAARLEMARAQGLQGAFLESGFSTTAQMVVWDSGAIVSAKKANLRSRTEDEKESSFFEAMTNLELLSAEIQKALKEWPSYSPEIWYDETTKSLFVSHGDWETPDNRPDAGGRYPRGDEVEQALLTVPGVGSVDVESEGRPGDEHFVKLDWKKERKPIEDPVVSNPLGSTYGSDVGHDKGMFYGDSAYLARGEAKESLSEGELHGWVLPDGTAAIKDGASHAEIAASVASKKDPSLFQQMVQDGLDDQNQVNRHAFDAGWMRMMSYVSPLDFIEATKPPTRRQWTTMQDMVKQELAGKPGASRAKVGIHVGGVDIPTVRLKDIATLTFDDFLRGKETESSSLQEGEESELRSDLVLFYELTYKAQQMRDRQYIGKTPRMQVVRQYESELRRVSGVIANLLLPIYEKWLLIHDLDDPMVWGKSRVDDTLDRGYETMSGMAAQVGDILHDPYMRKLEMAIEKDPDKFPEIYSSGALGEVTSYYEVVEYIRRSDGNAAARRALYELYAVLLFPQWFAKWGPHGIRGTYKRVATATTRLRQVARGYGVSNINKLVDDVNYIINVTHQTGPMLDYIQGEFDDVDRSFLDELSYANLDQFNKDLVQLGFVSQETGEFTKAAIQQLWRRSAGMEPEESRRRTFQQMVEDLLCEGVVTPQQIDAIKKELDIDDAMGYRQRGLPHLVYDKGTVRSVLDDTDPDPKKKHTSWLARQWRDFFTWMPAEVCRKGEHVMFKNPDTGRWTPGTYLETLETQGTSDMAVVTDAEHMVHTVPFSDVNARHRKGLDLTRETVQQSVSSVLNSFMEAKNAGALTGKEASIDSYETLRSLQDRLEKLNPEDFVSKRQMKRGRVGQYSSVPGVRLIAEEGDYRVYEVSTVTGAQVMGKNTAWCTRDPRAARDYIERGKLYVVTRQYREKEERIAQYHPDGSFMDADDQPVTTKEVISDPDYRNVLTAAVKAGAPNPAFIRMQEILSTNHWEDRYDAVHDRLSFPELDSYGGVDEAGNYKAFESAYPGISSKNGEISGDELLVNANADEIIDVLKQIEHYNWELGFQTAEQLRSEIEPWSEGWEEHVEGEAFYDAGAAKEISYYAQWINSPGSEQEVLDTGITPEELGKLRSYLYNTLAATDAEQYEKGLKDLFWFLFNDGDFESTVEFDWDGKEWDVSVGDVMEHIHDLTPKELLDYFTGGEQEAPGQTTLFPTEPAVSTFEVGSEVYYWDAQQNAWRPGIVAMESDQPDSVVVRPAKVNAQGGFAGQDQSLTFVAPVSSLISASAAQSVIGQNVATESKESTGKRDPASVSSTKMIQALCLLHGLNFKDAVDTVVKEE